jgi:hypothetical protein
MSQSGGGFFPSNDSYAECKIDPGSTEVNPKIDL